MASSYSNLHPVDQILTSLVVEAVPSDSQLIANEIFETIKVPERSGTCLLYTSPSPRDVEECRMPSSA